MKEKLTVKDVRKLTGLTGAQIAWFHHEKVVPAAGFSTYSVNDYDGYKYYNQDDLAKFQQIAMYYELGLKRNEIRDLMLAEGYHCSRALEELHRQLKEKKERIARHMIAIEHMQVFGTQGNALAVFSSLDFENWGSNYQRIQTLPAWIELQTLLPTILTEEFIKALQDQIASAESPDNAFAFITQNLGLIGYLLTAGAAVSILNNGTFA